MSAESKRDQAKQKLVPIVEKALDPLGRDYTGGDYLKAVEIAGEIVDLIMDGVKEEIMQELRVEMSRVALNTIRFGGVI